MRGMKAYYLSRLVLSLALGALFVITGSAWWMGVLIAGLAFVWFLVAPRLGRYAVHPELGASALRRDERSEAINAAAARNAFVVSMLAVGGLIIYHGALALDRVPLVALEALLVLGVLVYYASDFWLRRSQA